MLLVLDANEFIFAISKEKKVPCVHLLNFLASSKGLNLCKIRLVRSILREVTSNLAPEDRKIFFAIQQKLATIDEDMVIPFELVLKYERFGLKAGDAAIAAYAEYIGATHLITENRKDFLSHPDWFPFCVINAEIFLTAIVKPT